jgi:threonine dehydratase
MKPTMLSTIPPPLVRLSNLFPDRQVYAKCEFLAPSGCFKIRGAVHLLEHLTRADATRQLVVPSMGNTALGIAVGAKAYGFTTTAVVPKTLSRAKDEKLQALGVELVKIEGGGSDMIRRATELAQQRQAYFIHPHLDPLWTDGYQGIAKEILEALPACASLVFPVGGGGLLMGLTEYLRHHAAPVKLFGCEAYNYPTYVPFDYARLPTIAEGLCLEVPHAKVQERIAQAGIQLALVKETEIRAALAELFVKQGLVVEPSSAVATAFVSAHVEELDDPICVVLTGENITREDFCRLIQDQNPNHG